MVFLGCAVFAQTQETVIGYSGMPNVSGAATDASGNIFISGAYAGSNSTVYDLDPGPLTKNLEADATDSYLDAFLAKYSSAGTLFWTISAYTESLSTAIDIRKMVTDASGNVYVMGVVYGQYVYFKDVDSFLQVDGGNFSSGSQGRPYVVKINSAGQLQWAYSYYANSADSYVGNDMVIDGSGNLYIAGTFTASTRRAVLWKISNAGALISTTEFGLGTEGEGIAVDGSGNIYLTGVFYNTADFDPSGTTNNMTGNADGDAFMAKYNSSIVYQWAQRLTTTTTKETAYDIGIDGSGNLFTAVSAGNTMHLMKRTSTGAASTSISLTTSGTGFNPRYLFINSSNEVLLSGSLNGTADFDPSAGASSQTGGDYVVKYTNVLAFSFRIGNGPGLALTSSDKIVNASQNYTAVHTTGTADTTSPTISSLLPANSATNIGVGDNLVMTFSENIVVENGNTISIKRTSDNAVFATYTLPSANVTVGSNTVTINPSTDLANGTGYYVNVDAGAFKDLVGRDYAGIANTTSWNFTTLVADGTPPTISSLSPIDGATGVSVTANLVTTFSENVTAVATKVVSIRRSSDNALFESYTLPSGNVTVSGATVTINPTNSLAGLTGYYVNIDAGAFEDAAGNDFAGIANNTSWNFTTVSTDVTPPTVSSFSPAHMAINVAVNTNLVINFSENVVVGSSKLIRIIKSNGLVLHEQYALPSPNVTVSGATVTINPTNDFLNSESYYVTIESGAFTDAAGNSYAGLASNGFWDFTTAAPVDTAPPTIATLNPVNTGMGLALDANVLAIFNENVSAVNGKVIAIKRMSDNSIFESYTLPSANVGVGANAVTINPTGNFLNSTSYYVTIDAGAFQDAAGNPFAGIANNSVWSFTTEAAALQNQTITFNALATKTFGDASFALTATASSGLSVTYVSSNTSVATISGNMVTIVGAGSSTITASQAGNGSFNPAPSVQQILTVNKANQTITFAALPGKQVGDAAFGLTATASSGLTVSYSSSNTAVATVSGSTVTIVGAGSTTITASQAGNTNFNAAANIQQTLNVASAPPVDVTPPAITSSTPASGTTGVSVNLSSIVIQFNESIFSGTSNNLILQGPNYNQYFDFNQSTQALFNGSTLTLYPNAPLPGGSVMTVYLYDQSIRDASNNFITGYQFSFTTESTFSVASFSPTQNATNVLPSANLTITFNENVDIGSGTISVHKVSDNSQVTSLSNFNGTYMTLSGANVTFNFPADLPANTELYVNVTNGYLRSSANGNNTWGGIQNNTAWRFTTSKLDQTITFDALEAKTFGNANFDLTATASSGLPVSYTSSNTAVATVSGNTVSIVGVGSTTITASQAGNTSYNPASNVQQTLTVSKANQTITFGALSTKIFGDANFTLGATSTSGLSVSYTSSNTTVATISGNTVTIVGAGSTTITASQAGNTNYNAAANVQQTLTVNKANQTISFAPLAAKTVGDAPFNLAASASSGLTVSYTSSNTAVATVSGNTVTIVAAGTATITASQSGNTNFNAASSVQQTLTVNLTDLTPPSVASFSPSNNATDIPLSTTLSITFNESIKLAANGSTKAFIIFTLENDFSELIPLSSGNITGSTVSVNYSNLSAGRTYYIKLEADVIADISNNNFSGFTANNVWRFSTIKANQTISFSAISPKTFGDSPFNLTATASSSLPVSYTSSNVSVATVSGSTITIVGAGSTTITASQSGNGSFNAAPSVQQILTVSKANQTITFGALVSKTFGDPDFTLSATTTSGLPVSYSSSNTAVATVSGNTVTIVGAGSTTITASQSGNTNYNAATNAQQTLTVNKADQTITFNTLTSKTYGDANFSVTASASSGLSVSYNSSNTAVATISGNTVTIVGAGTTNITATQGGNASYNAATSVVRALTVNKADQTITFEPLAAKGISDPPFSLTATSTSGLTISYTSSNTAVATVSGNTVTIVGLGSTTITASQSGNANFNAATAAQQALTVNGKQSQSITFNALTTKTFGDANFNLTATASSNLSVSYTSSNINVATINGSTVTIVGAGTTIITATQSGDGAYNPAASVQQSLVVSKADQTITFSSLVPRMLNDGSFQLSATASSGLAVLFSSSNTSVATISGTTVTLVSPGTTTITASQSGNANYNAATAVDRLLTVNDKQSQTITFNALATKTFGDAAFTLSANATSGLSISYTSSNTSVATISGSAVTIVGAGTTVIKASQAGDNQYLAAADVEQTLTVNKANQTITFTLEPQRGLTAGSFDLTGTASSGLPVAYTSANTDVATISGSTVTVLKSGSVTITATQSGNANYNAAATVQATINIVDDTPKRIISLTGNLAFGDIILPEKGTKTFTISNTGTDVLTINSITFPTGFSGDLAAGSTINAGANKVVTVTFTPTEAKEYSGTVSLTSNATSGTSTIAVSGKGVVVTALPDLDLKVTAFPNPSRGTYLLTIVNLKSKSVGVSDELGRSIGEFELHPAGQNQYQLDVSSLQDGIYFIRIQTEQKLQSIRVIKVN